MSWTVRRAAVFFITSCALVPLIASCGAAQGAMNAAGEKAGVGGKCPDLTKPESIISFDFAGNFKLSADAATKLKGAVAASVDIKGFADGVDADLKASCGNIAKDLGATGDFPDGKSACDAAVKAINDARAKIGASAKIDLTVKEPRCSVDMNVYADCAGKCDVKASGPQAKVECEPGKLSGTCDANCDGSCDLSASAKCDGECSGTCDATMKGSCGGKCSGKCDGSTSSGASCGGTCEGKCDAQVKGSCSGKCGGTCKLKAAAKCQGTCTGNCSVEMKAPKCTGDVKPPQMSADCKAHCDASVSAKAECTPAQVSLSVSGKADAAAFDKLRVTLEKNLPAILKIAIGLGDRAAKMAANVQAVVEGVQASVKDIAASGGGNAALKTGELTACFADAFKGAIGAAGSLQANVKVSASVSASASGSASGGTK